MEKKFHFYTDCVSSDGPSINAMVDQAREVTLATFRKHCEAEDWERAHGYEREGKGGLPLSRDWHVRFFKSKYRGRPCYYITHSAIEHIFIER